jgi:hypothetical protein
MELTIDELLRGKGTQIKGKEYLPTAAYVEPFLERLSPYTNDFRVQVKLPDQITLTENGGVNMEDITFNRVWVQAIMPDELNYENHRDSVSLLYALDTRKPVVKIFKSGVNMACLNMCIFNPSYINLQSLEPEAPINFKCVKPLMEEVSDTAMWMHKLEETEVPYNYELINENLGMWIRNSIKNTYDSGYGKVKLATSTPIDAYKLLYEKKDSPYYVEEGASTNMFNVYNAFTELVTNDGTKEDKRGGDLCCKAEKTLMIKDILQLV